MYSPPMLHSMDFLAYQFIGLYMCCGNWHLLISTLWRHLWKSYSSCVSTKFVSLFVVDCIFKVRHSYISGCGQQISCVSADDTLTFRASSHMVLAPNWTPSMLIDGGNSRYIPVLHMGTIRITTHCFFSTEPRFYNKLQQLYLKSHSQDPLTEGGV